MSTSTAFVVRRFGPMVYLPTILFSLGEGAVIPLIPWIASRLGADIAFSALIASALVVGQLCGNVPAGWLVSRFGERLTMVLAAVVAIAAASGILWAPSIPVFGGSVFLLGLCASAFALARHAFMTTRVPIDFRARALSLLGGSFRLGAFIGPFVAAALLWMFGTEAAASWFFIGCLLLMAVLLVVGSDPEKQFHAIPPDVVEDSGEAVSGSTPVPVRRGVLRSIWDYRRLLSRLGLAAAALSGVRSARTVVLPLWGVSLGMDAQTIATVVGVSGAIDFALFYASGQVMDRFGRLWAALPAMVVMGCGFLALSVTHDLASATMWFAMFAVVLGVGNGLSSGVLLTLGADVAPQHDPAPFLGAWRILTDAGGATAPLVISGVTAIASLPIAVALMGVVGLAGAVGFIRWIPRFVPRR